MLLNHFGEILCYRDEIEQIDKKYFTNADSGSKKWHVDDSAMGEINGLLDKIVKYYVELTDKHKIPKVSWTQKLNGPGIWPPPIMTNIVQVRYADYTVVMPHGGSIGCQQMWEMSNAGFNSRRFDAIQRIVREIGLMIKDAEATCIIKDNTSVIAVAPSYAKKIAFPDNERNKRRIEWERQQKELTSIKLKTPSKRLNFSIEEMSPTLDKCVKEAIQKSDNQVINDTLKKNDNEETPTSLNEHLFKYHSFDNLNIDLSEIMNK